MPPGENTGILFANGFAVAYSIAAFSIVMATISSVAGAVAAIVLKRSLLHFNPKFNSQKAAMISFTIAALFLAVMYILLKIFLKDRMSFQYPETFLFWFVFPAVICFVVSIITGHALNKELGGYH